MTPQEEPLSADTPSTEEESAESDWGFESKKSALSKEAKIGVALILLLVGAFSFVVYKKLNPQTETLADATEEVIEPDLGEAGDGSDMGDDPFGQDAPDPIGGGEASTVAGNGKRHEDEVEFFSENAIRSQNGERDVSEPDDWGEEFAQREPDFDDEDEPAPWDDSSNRPPGGQTEPDPFDNGGNEDELPREFAEQQSEPEFDFDFDDAEPSPARDSAAGAQSARNPVALEDSIDPFGNEDFDAGSDPFADERPQQSSPDEHIRTGEVEDDDFFANLSSEKSERQQPSAQEPEEFDAGEEDDDFDMFLSERSEEEARQSAESNRASTTIRRSEEEETGGAADEPDVDFEFLDGPRKHSDERYGDFRPLNTIEQRAESKTVVTKPESGEREPDSADAFESLNDDDEVESLFPRRAAAPQAGQPEAEADDFSNEMADPPFDPNDSAEENPFGDRSSFDGDRSSGVSRPFGGEGTDNRAGVQSPTEYPRKPAASPVEDFLQGDDQTYVVQPNDNYWSISKNQYGTPAYFEALALYNKKRISDPKKMQPGMEILIPPPDVLEARYPELFPTKVSRPADRNGRPASAGAARSSSEGDAAGFFRDAQGQPRYRIGEQDTLSNIAQRHLGRSTRWIQIYEMNRELLEDPDDLKIGAVLRLPADANTGQVVQNPDGNR